MDNIIKILPYEEQIPLKLRALYEGYGYKKYSMSNFEPYDLYSENRNFIGNAGIITFTDANGKLMALRPDVTTSIVKNAGEASKTEKLYYIENVFRMQQKTKEYKEINQMGLEYIGGGEGYAEAEVIFLALKTLDNLGADYRLNVSHMGLVEGMLDYMGFDEDVCAEIKSMLKHKNVHDILTLAQISGAADEKLKSLEAFCLLHSDWDTAVAKLEAACANDTMKAALTQLKNMKETVAIMTDVSKLQLDISVINDMDYYNGTVFRGYIKEAAGAVLSGGRYDKMMKRFGKEQPAIGFGIYLGELYRAFHSKREYDADVMLVTNGAQQRNVAKKVKEISESGQSVYVCESGDCKIKTKATILMKEAE